MTERNLQSQLCASVVILAQIFAVCLAADSGCTVLPEWLCPKLQVIVSGESVLYSYEKSIENHTWCIDGIPANRKQKFTVGAEGWLTYSNPLPGDMENGKPLYLINESAESHCDSLAIRDYTVTIQSNVNGISMSARLILLHVVEAIYCPELPNPLNGQVNNLNTTENGTKINQTANFQCNTGYHSNDAMTLQCVRDGVKMTGKWSSEPPTCEPIMCDRQTAIPNGRIEHRLCNESKSTLTNAEKVPYGTIASYSCDWGFILTGGNETQTCEVSTNNSHVSVWSRTKPTCTEITCEPISQPLNGKILYSGNTNSEVSSERSSRYKIGTTANYSCDRGYRMSPEGITPTRECQERGHWTSKSFVCIAVNCPDLEDPLNGMISLDNKSKSIGSVLTYTCNQGLTPSGGSTQRNCTLVDTGEAMWDGKPPICTNSVQAPYGATSICTEQDVLVAAVVPSLLLVALLLVIALTGIVCCLCHLRK